jgi:hypothetical protein
MIATSVAETIHDTAYGINRRSCLVIPPYFSSQS